MHIVVPLRTVPDLAEDLELTPDQTDIDREFLSFSLSEWDGQALEEALLLKEAGDARVTVVGLTIDHDIDQALYSALAKGADEAVRLTAAGSGDGGELADAGAEAGGHVRGTMRRAALIAGYLTDHPADLVLTGVQSVDDLDAQLHSALGGFLPWPHVSAAVSVTAGAGEVAIRQELAGGRAQDLAVRLPGIAGIQAARQAPRYVPVSRLRQAMQAGGITELQVRAAGSVPGLTVRAMQVAQAGGQAQMLPAEPGGAAAAIAELLRARGLVKG